ncbi:MAG: 50S ribosomal protein L25/general stress protein Ctc [Thermacetogeniaceae bacterium]|jgi:large subunit ribosomal protein L25|nr:50S ribosomal protein L25/general stress protein Ctc [Thermoanaerobacterales bacterium]HAF17292.1 50S ribosomal protein L25 [Peptococcaceae bacterium]
METVKLSAQYRERSSKEAVRALRRKGETPAVLYGKGVGNMPIKVSTKELEYILNNNVIGSTLIDLDVDKGEKRESYLVMCREVQRDPLRRELLHADFFQIELTQEIQTEIPVVLIGEPQGVQKGGILQHMLRGVAVSCLPTKLPEQIEIDISGLDIGEQVTVGDLEAPEGVQILSEPESVIALVVAPTVEEEEEEAEEEVAEEVEVDSSEQGEE